MMRISTSVVHMHNDATSASAPDLGTEVGVGAAAEILRRHPSSVTRAIQRGELAARKVDDSGQYVIRLGDVYELRDAWLENPPRPGPKPRVDAEPLKESA